MRPWTLIRSAVNALEADPRAYDSTVYATKSKVSLAGALMTRDNVMPAALTQPSCRVRKYFALSWLEEGYPGHFLWYLGFEEEDTGSKDWLSFADELEANPPKRRKRQETKAVVRAQWFLRHEGLSIENVLERWRGGFKTPVSGHLERAAGFWEYIGKPEQELPFYIGE